MARIVDVLDRGIANVRRARVYAVLVDGAAASGATVGANGTSIVFRRPGSTLPPQAVCGLDGVVKAPPGTVPAAARAAVEGAARDAAAGLSSTVVVGLGPASDGNAALVWDAEGLAKAAALALYDSLAEGDAAAYASTDVVFSAVRVSTTGGEVCLDLLDGESGTGLRVRERRPGARLGPSFSLVRSPRRGRPCRRRGRAAPPTPLRPPRPA